MEDDESLPDIPFIGLEESKRLNELYEAKRKVYRMEHPHLTKEELEKKPDEKDLP